MIKLRAKELIIIVMVQSTLASDWMINSMVKVKKFGQMEQNILEHMLMGKKKAKEVSFGLMDQNMKAIFIRTVFMEQGLIHGLTGDNTLEIGKTIKCMVKGNSNGQMDGNIQVII